MKRINKTAALFLCILCLAPLFMSMSVFAARTTEAATTASSGIFAGYTDYVIDRVYFGAGVVIAVLVICAVSIAVILKRKYIADADCGENDSTQPKDE
ncbi:MAG: hypothetical protein UHG68_01950 [Clostridia bacterium]|nr:hypothetical protein [Clostridia bacterium]